MKRLVEHIRRSGAVRSVCVAAGLSIVFAVLGLRAAAIATSPDVASDTRLTGYSEIKKRADIVDRDGELLATSVTVYSLFADPRLIWDTDEVVEALAQVFPDIDRQGLRGRLENRERRFEWIRRGLTPRQRQAVFDLGLEGLHFREEVMRAYPKGVQAGHVLGHTDVDGIGRMGLEKAFDAQLALGGDPLQLTLDAGVQFAIESELTEAAGEFGAEAATGIVIDVRSGDLLALASWPSFDPNRPDRSSPEQQMNRATGAVYELGSVFKPLTIAAALETGAVDLSDRFDISKPAVIAGQAITDTHKIGAVADVTEILAESSNIGTLAIADRLGAEGLTSFYQSSGLFERPQFDFAASAAPLLPERWGPLEVATLSFGHGFAVSPLAFAEVFAALGNDGAIKPLNIVLGGEDKEPQRLVSGEVARLTVDLLRVAVTRGTGTSADIVGYEVAGKTGTAEKPIAGGYSETRNVSSFIALFPASSPQFVVMVVLDEPRLGEGEGATAARAAAPVTGRVIERIAPILGVSPRLEGARPPARTPDDRSAP
ncbi:MAG: penicillin-binding protein 2 [Pseudomonadota bacterium]